LAEIELGLGLTQVIEVDEADLGSVEQDLRGSEVAVTELWPSLL
jgi:hypothetical protein